MKIITYLLAFLLPVLITSCVTEVRNEIKINLDACVPITYQQEIIGSGVVVNCLKVKEEYYIDVLTAKHVAVNYGIGVYVNKQHLKVVDKILHAKLDVAILKCISASPVTPAKCQNSEPRPLDVIYTVGYPLGISQVITTGIINHASTNIAEGTWLCSSPAMPGNSGGGVFNHKGELIGVTVAIVFITDGNVKIPIPHLQFFIACSNFSVWTKGVADGG